MSIDNDHDLIRAAFSQYSGVAPDMGEHDLEDAIGYLGDCDNWVPRRLVEYWTSLTIEQQDAIIRQALDPYF